MKQPGSSKSILKPALQVDGKEVQWYFIADYYDAPIAGLAFFRGRVHRFCCFQEDVPEQHVYVLHALTPEELSVELLHKQRFEASVGTHWSFDEAGQPLAAIQPPAGAAQRFYDKNTPEPSPQPSDRPIVAWFDISPSNTVR